MKRAVFWILALLAVIGLSCGGSPAGLTSPSTLPIGSRAEIPSGVDVGALFPTEIFVGAGDIAQCTNGGVPQATARLLDSIDGTVFALGDNAYPSGRRTTTSRAMTRRGDATGRARALFQAITRSSKFEWRAATGAEGERLRLDVHPGQRRGRFGVCGVPLIGARAWGLGARSNAL